MRCLKAYSLPRSSYQLIHISSLYQLIHPHDTSIIWSILTTPLSVDPSARHRYQLIHPHDTSISWSILTTPLSADPSSRHHYQLFHPQDTSISWSILTTPLSADPSSRHLYYLTHPHETSISWSILTNMIDSWWDAYDHIIVHSLPKSSFLIVICRTCNKFYSSYLLACYILQRRTFAEQHFWTRLNFMSTTIRRYQWIHPHDTSISWSICTTKYYAPVHSPKINNYNNNRAVRTMDQLIAASWG